MRYRFPKNIPNILRWDPKSLFRDRDFLLLWFSQVSTLIGGSILGLVVVFMADTGELLDHEMSTSGSAMGLVILLNNAPSFFVAFIAGVLADWFDRKSIMIRANLFRFSLLLVFLLFAGWEYAIFAYLIIFLKSAAKQFFIPAEASLLPDIVAKENIMTANSIFNLTNYVTYLLGFIIAGPLLRLLGAEALVIVLMLMFLAASISLIFVRAPEREYKKISLGKYMTLLRDFVGSFVEGISYIFKDKIQRIMLVHNLVSMSFLYIFLALIFKLGEFLIGLTPTNIGLVAVMPLGLGIISSVILMDKKFKKEKRIKLSLLGVIIEFFAFAVLHVGSLIRWHDLKILGVEADVSVLVFTMVGVVLVGLGFPLLIIPSQTLIQEKTKQGFLGRVFGVWFALSQAIASIPAVIIGYAADFVIGVPTTLLWLAIIACCYGLVLSKYRNLA